jgi:histidine triad (HIT) family protein
MSDQECVFCQIVAGKIPAVKVYEDKDVVAFLDIYPIQPGHTLVVPKIHVDEFQDLGGDLYDHVMGVVQKLSRRVKEVLNPPRVGLVVAGFDIPHTHVHIIPQQSRDDIPDSRTLEQKTGEPDHEALAKVAARLQA